MATCFICRDETDTRRLFAGSARGFADMCFDCTIRFYKLQKED